MRQAIRFPEPTPPTVAQLQAMGRRFHLRIPDSVMDDQPEHRKAALAAMGRTIARRLRIEAPELYDSLVGELTASGVFRERARMAMSALAAAGTLPQLADLQVAPSAVAEVVGDVLLQPTVWRTFIEPSLTTRVAEWARGSQPDASVRGGLRSGSRVWENTDAAAAVTVALQDFASMLTDSAREAELQALESAHAIARRRESRAGLVTSVFVVGAMGGGVLGVAAGPEAIPNAALVVGIVSAGAGLLAAPKAEAAALAVREIESAHDALTTSIDTELDSDNEGLCP